MMRRMHLPKGLIAFTLLGALGGAGYRWLYDPAIEHTPGFFAQSMTQGALAMAVLWLVNAGFVALDARLSRRPSLLASLLARSIVLSLALIAAIVLSEILFEGGLPRTAWFERTLPRTVPAILLGSFLTQVGVAIVELIGAQDLLSFVLGRYRRPILEERCVLFADLAGSTRLAERLGEARAQALLSDLFRSLDPVIRRHGGRVMAYVGDEVIVTWPAARADHCLACGTAMLDALESIGPRFERDFATRPALRITAHAGRAAIGEIGESRKQITLFGDVVNVTARLQEEAKARDERFLVSADLLARAGGPSKARPLGPLRLRGREAAVEVYAL